MLGLTGFPENRVMGGNASSLQVFGLTSVSSFVTICTYIILSFLYPYFLFFLHTNALVDV